MRIMPQNKIDLGYVDSMSKQAVEDELFKTRSKLSYVKPVVILDDCFVQTQGACAPTGGESGYNAYFS